MSNDVHIERETKKAVLPFVVYLTVTPHRMRKFSSLKRVGEEIHGQCVNCFFNDGIESAFQQFLLFSISQSVLDPVPVFFLLCRQLKFFNILFRIFYFYLGTVIFKRVFTLETCSFFFIHFAFLFYLQTSTNTRVTLKMQHF